MRIAVIAFGTRGDVQPLVVLAAGLRQRASWCTGVVIATHTCFRTLVYSIAFDPPDLDNTEAAAFFRFVAVDSPPLLWKGLAGSDAVEASASRAQEDGVLEACQEVGLIIFNMFALEAYHVAEKMQVPCAVCHPYLPATPMPASFPLKMRRAYPQLFRSLTRVPDAAESKRIPNSENSSGSSPDDGSRSPSTCAQSISRQKLFGESAWVHVEHWMWPLFTNKWATFRERLGLHPCPLADVEAVRSGFPPATLDEEKDDSIKSLRRTATIHRARLPLVLYLFSPLVVDTSPFWPCEVRVCGYIFYPSRKVDLSTASKDCGAEGTLNPQTRRVRNDGPEMTDYGTNRTIDTAAPRRATATRLPYDVEAFLSSSEDRPLYIGFGSMWSMCAPGYGLAFAVRVMVLGARQASRRCLVVLPAEDEIGFGRVSGRMMTGMEGDDAARKSELDVTGDFLRDKFTPSLVERGDLLVHRGPLAHDLVLQRCVLAVHHGGSGTTAAVLRAGIPHVVCPQHLDQFFWAERVRHLALGGIMERSLFVGHESSPNVPPISVISKAASTILSALTPQVRLRAACLGVKIRAEDGLQTTLDALSLYSHSRHSLLGGTTSANTASSPLRNLSSMRGARGGEPCIQPSQSENRQTKGRVSVDGTLSAALSKEDDVGEKDLVMREMPNGVSIWCGGRAEEEVNFIYGEVFEDRVYARMGVRVQDGDTVWDVGANVGLASIFFELETDAPDSLNLYAFEPIPLNRVALKRNLFEHCPRALILGYALGARNEDGATATFYPRMPGNSTFRPQEKERLQGTLMKLGDRGTRGKRSSLIEGSSSEERRSGFFYDIEQVLCDVRTVSWAMGDLGVDKIDLLKVDVEGAELVVVEVHPVGDRVSQACKLFRDQGFDVTAQALALDGTPLSPMASPQQGGPCSLPTSPITDISNVELKEVADGMVYMVYAKRCSR